MTNDPLQPGYEGLGELIHNAVALEPLPTVLGLFAYRSDKEEDFV